jgi:hypothetical protein
MIQPIHLPRRRRGRRLGRVQDSALRSEGADGVAAHHERVARREVGASETTVQARDPERGAEHREGPQRKRRAQPGDTDAPGRPLVLRPAAHLREHASDRLVGGEAEGLRHRPNEAAHEAVWIGVEGAALEPLQRAHGDAGRARQLLDLDPAQAALASEVAADRLRRLY